MTIVLSTRRVAAIRVAVLLALFVLFNFYSGYGQRFDGGPINWRSQQSRSVSVSFRNRKLMLLEPQAGEPSETDQVGDECNMDDIIVHQGATAPLPNGIPTYTVEVLNVCSRGYSIGRIHLSCGWFSSARLINPGVFRRLRYNDCLLNDGRPLSAGSSLSFQYANSFRFPLSVSSVTCAPSSSPQQSP